MNELNRSIGIYGETLALNYLKKNGHLIICKNFKAHGGEIDIISKINNIIVFTEVKSRYSKKFGFPLDAVSKFKVMHIKKAASYFIYKRHLKNLNFRFDVIELYFNYYDDKFKINHIINAF